MPTFSTSKGPDIGLTFGSAEKMLAIAGGCDTWRDEFMQSKSDATKEKPIRLSRSERQAIPIIIEAKQKMLEAEFLILEAKKLEVTEYQDQRSDFLEDISAPTKDRPGRRVGSDASMPTSRNADMKEQRRVAEQLLLEAEWMMLEIISTWVLLW